MHRVMKCLLMMASFVVTMVVTAHAKDVAQSDREYSVKVLDRIAGPVIRSLAEGKLKQQLPLGPGEQSRRDFTHLEAFGRTLSGIAPWLALGADDSAEGKLRQEYADLSRKALVMATDPASPDRMNFSRGGQPLVDAAFFSLALLRAPQQLWEPLSTTQKNQVAACLRETRAITPPQNNWLLFSALVESALWKFTGECEKKSIEIALQKHEEWYVGDGTYGDGPQYHWDFYNSFVIQPALLAVLTVCEEKHSPLAKELPRVIARARRYAEVQERLISPEGTYPVIGRSSSYRFGAVQSLSLMSLRRELPASVTPAAVRCALTTVIRRMIEAPGTFDENGWLRVGVVGHQPAVRENYISTGSLYLCLNGMLHLGLPAHDPFWTDSAQAWTQKRLWAGENVPADHAH